MADSLYGPADAQPTIWIYLEQQDGYMAPVSRELVSKGRALAAEAGWSVTGFLAGSHVASLAAEAIALGADRVLVAEDPLLAEFDVEAIAAVLFNALIEEHPAIFLLGATPDGRDLAGRLAVRLRTGLNADCTDLTLDAGRGVLVSEVSGFGGGVLALIEMATHRPQMATVRPGVFPAGTPDARRAGEIRSIDVNLDSTRFRTRRLESEIGHTIDLTLAPVIVAGGRGVEGDFALLHQLAELLEGEVGATRPPVDDGYVERERQIGQTGVVCRPKIAIACGISGAFHFVVGIQEADLVVAINSDPEAPIFDYADYCIVGDVQQVVPALIARLVTEAPVASQKSPEAGRS